MEDEALEKLGNLSATEVGARDGEIEIPSNQNPVRPAFLDKVVGFTNLVVADIGKEWLEEDELLYARQKMLSARLGAAWSSEPRNGTSASDEDVLAAAPTLPQWTFWVFVTAIVVADFPLTLTVFEALSPGRGGIFDYLLAIGVQAVLFAAAKAAGILLHKTGATRPSSRSAVVGVGLLAFLVVVASVSLAIFRSDVVRDRLAQTTAGQITSLFQPTSPPDVDTAPTPPVSEETPDAAPEGEGIDVPSLLTFGSLLIMTFAVGTILGWLTHAPHAQTLARKLAAVRAERRRRFETADAEAVSAEVHARSLWSSYWNGNIGARREPVSPAVQELAAAELPLAGHPWRRDPDKYDF